MTRERSILHVDMDAFYAAIEQRDRPELSGKCVIVGGTSRRSVVSTASYEARRFGVRSAMPMHEARARCPHAIVLLPRMHRYSEVSEQIFAIFSRFTPLVEGLSLDEAFLDVTASSLFGDAETIARTLQSAIEKEIGLTASVGVAPNKWVAKIASDLKKPRGLVVVSEQEKRAFLAPLPIEKMWGLGAVRSALLRQHRFLTLGDLASSDPERIVSLIGKGGYPLWQRARGDDSRPVEPNRPHQSIGAEQTFVYDVWDREKLFRSFLQHAERIASRLQRMQIYGSSLSIKVKYHDFSQTTRQTKLKPPLADTLSIFQAAKDLFSSLGELKKPLRLTGISVGGLLQHPPLSLFEEQRCKQEKLEATLLQVRSRYGTDRITRAALLSENVAKAVDTARSRLR